MSDANIDVPFNAKFRTGCAPLLFLVAFVGFLGFDGLLATQGSTFANVLGDDTIADAWGQYRWLLLWSFPVLAAAIRWTTHWALLPRPTTTIVPGIRTTIEGKIVAADELLDVPVPEKPGEQCVAWVCENHHQSTGDGDTIPVRRVPRSRPFSIELADGQIVHISIGTANWNTLGFGFRPQHIPKPLREGARLDELLKTALEEYPHSHEDLTAPSFRWIWFATIHLGDHATISGVFTKHGHKAHSNHDREQETEQSYLVTRACEAAPRVSPRGDRRWHFLERGTARRAKDHVLFFPASHREAHRLLSPAGLEYSAKLLEGTFLWAMFCFLVISFKVGVFGL